MLRLLGSTPLGRSGLLVAKTAAVLVVETVQVLLISPRGSPARLGARGVVGRGGAPADPRHRGLQRPGAAARGHAGAEATLAAANGIYLLLLAVGGVVIPADRLPGPLAGLVSLLPSAALGQGLRDVLLHGLGFPVAAAAVLVVWAGVAGVLTARTFRWS